MNIAEEALEAALVFRACLVLSLFEGCVADEDLALFAPVAWLKRISLVRMLG